MLLLLGAFFEPTYVAKGYGDSLGISPFLEWKTLTTAHFNIHYPVELTEIAKKTATLYEEAHEKLQPVFKWTPRSRTEVTILDNSDLANGLTSPVNRFGMILMVTPPETWFSTYHYDDWLRLLVFHEYTHFLNIDPTKSLWEVSRWIFGDSVRPNGLWPVWMLEGFAVYVETRWTAGAAAAVRFTT